MAEKIGLGQEFSQGRTASQWLEAIYEDLRISEPELPDFKTLKEAGIYRYRNNPAVVAFEKQRQNPESYPFPTPSGKVEIFSETVFRGRFAEYFPAIPRYVDPPEGPKDPLVKRYPLQLIGWHTKRRCHSIHDNNLEMHSIDPQCLWMHPDDARERGIRDGETVLAWNSRGRVRIPVKITDRIVRGVVGMAQGAWYRPDKDKTDLGGSINVLTSQRPTPYARGNPQHTNLVQVSSCKSFGL